MEELSSVIISVVNSDLTSVDANINADREILGHEGSLGAVLLQNHLSLKENTLGSTGVDLSRFGQHDGLVFQEVENNDSTDTMVFKS